MTLLPELTVVQGVWLPTPPVELTDEQFRYSARVRPWRDERYESFSRVIGMERTDPRNNFCLVPLRNPRHKHTSNSCHISHQEWWKLDHARWFRRRLSPALFQWALLAQNYTDDPARDILHDIECDHVELYDHTPYGLATKGILYIGRLPDPR